MIDKIDFVSAEIMQNKLTQCFKKIPKQKRHTYTYGNGTEIGKEDAELEKKIGIENLLFPIQATRRC